MVHFEGGFGLFLKLFKKKHNNSRKKLKENPQGFGKV